MSQNIETIKKGLKEYEPVLWEDFPQVDLYMDQVLSLLTRWLSPLFFDQDKPPVTASMINNYVKNSIVKPPVKKHYKNYHLAYLYVVILLKQCYSLSEVSTLIRIYSDLENPERISRDFNSFSRVFTAMLHEVMEKGEITNTYYENPTWQQTLMINALRTVVSRIYTSFVITGYNARAAIESETEVSEPSK